VRFRPSWWSVRSPRYWLVVAAAAPAGLVLGALLTTQFAQPPHDALPRAAASAAVQTPRIEAGRSPAADTDDATQARNAAFVRAVYQDAVGTPPAPVALEGWLRALSGGTSREQVAAAILVSPEYGVAFKEATFRRLLGRPADGAADWGELLKNGAPPEQLYSAVLGSDEYYRRVGGSDLDWLAAIYRELLGRDPVPAEVDYQLATLARGAGRVDIAYGLTQSEEYRRRLLGDLFRRYLGRAPSDDELHWLLSVLVAGQPSTAVRAALLGSDEYLRRHAPV